MRRITADFLGTANEVSELVGGLDGRCLIFRPRIADAWTIEEHVNHLLKIDVFGFLETNPWLLNSKTVGGKLATKPWNEIDSLSGMTALDSVRWLRETRESIVTKIVGEGTPSGHIVSLKKSDGEVLSMRLGDALAALAGHIRYHLTYIARNVDEYLK